MPGVAQGAIHPLRASRGWWLRKTDYRSEIYFNTLVSQYWRHKEGFGPFGVYYEFGVGSGASLVSYVKSLKLFCSYIHENPLQFPICAFDSFRGLPSPSDSKDLHPTWTKGTSATPLDEVKRRVQRELNLSKSRIRFVEGFFEDTLTADLRDRIGGERPSFVMLDVDYYSSAKLILEWLRPFMQSGCLVYVDDVWWYYGNPRMGELAAVNEFNAAGDGLLTPYTEIMNSCGGRLWVYSKKEFEYSRAGETRR